MLQKNKNVFVLKNGHGKERYFCLIDQDELKQKSSFKSICSNYQHNPSIKSLDHREVKNYKFSSIQNLFNLKKEDKFLNGTNLLTFLKDIRFLEYF